MDVLADRQPRPPNGRGFRPASPTCPQPPRLRGVASALALAMACVALLAACAGSGETPSREFVTVMLKPGPELPAQAGRAYLMPQEGGTRVQIEITGVPAMIVSRPVHLYTYIHRGRCGALVSPPAYSLLGTVLAGSPASTAMAPAHGPYTVSNVAPLPLPELRAGGFAIVVRSAPSDGDRELFCGDVS